MFQTLNRTRERQNIGIQENGVLLSILILKFLLELHLFQFLDSEVLGLQDLQHLPVLNLSFVLLTEKKNNNKMYGTL